MTVPIIETGELKKYFRVKKGLFGNRNQFVHAVDDVSLTINERETLALVGESGCGKTTLGRVLLRLEEKTSGRILYRGRDIHALDKDAMRDLRKKMQIIFQDPYASLNPRLRIRSILAEPLKAHHYGSAAEIDQRTHELLKMVGLREHFIRRYPHQFSGGQRQRIGIAPRIGHEP